MNKLDTKYYNFILEKASSKLLDLKIISQIDKLFCSDTTSFEI